MRVVNARAGSDAAVLPGGVGRQPHPCTAPCGEQLTRAVHVATSITASGKGGGWQHVRCLFNSLATIDSFLYT